MKAITLQNLLAAVTASSIVSYTGRDGRIKYINQNFLTISGYSETELIGSDHSIVSSGYHPKGFWQNAWQTITKGKVWRNEVLNRGKHGNLYWVDTFIYPFQDEKGDIVGYLSITNDITARKNAEIELEIKNELLEKIAWIQSHQFRHPVGNIIGLINLFETSQNDKDMVAEAMENLKIVAKELDRAIHFVVALTEEIEIVNKTNEMQVNDFIQTFQLKAIRG